ISIPPDALPRKIDPSWRGEFSSGAKLGLPRTRGDEFFTGLPISSDGQETTLSNEFCRVTGRFAAQA
ncbi:hypothetical protein ACJRO7_036292, partial [Eucalyptus globulus]